MKEVDGPATLGGTHETPVGRGRGVEEIRSIPLGSIIYDSRLISTPLLLYDGEGGGVQLILDESDKGNLEKG
jgi:hypothetical protein